MALAPITDAEIAAGKPITQSLLTRLRDAAYAGGGAGGGLNASRFTADGTFTVPANVVSIAIAMSAEDGDDWTDTSGATKLDPDQDGGVGGKLYGVFDVTAGDTITMDFDVDISVSTSTYGRPASRKAINVVVGSTQLQVFSGGDAANGRAGGAGGATAGYGVPADAGIAIDGNAVIIRT